MSYFQGGKCQFPVFAGIYQYLPVFTGKYHRHGKYSYLPAFCQPWWGEGGCIPAVVQHYLFKISCNVSQFLFILMWHKFKKALFSYYSKKVNGIMRTCHKSGFTLSLNNIPVYSPCDRPLYSRLLTDRPAGINFSTC